MATPTAPATGPASGTVARLRYQFEQQPPGSAQQQEGGGVGTAAAQQRKRARLDGWRDGQQPVASPWEPTHDKQGGADGGADVLSGRQLWPNDSEEPGSAVDMAAREARLVKIRAKFGTKRFHPPKQVEPAELRRQLGADETDLQPADYVLQRWEPMPVVLSQCSNAHIKSFVLSGMSGCVALASSLTHLFVLGAGETIWIADADTVKAERCGQEGIFIRFDAGDFVSIKVAEEAAGSMIEVINARAAKRVALRAKAGASAGAASAGAAGAQPAAAAVSPAPPAAQPSPAGKS